MADVRLVGQILGVQGIAGVADADRIASLPPHRDG
jgi:hypothetical protein